MLTMRDFFYGRSQLSDVGVLIGQRKPRLALVRRDEVKIHEFSNVTPARCHLAVGDFEHAMRNSARQLWNGGAVENTVAEIAEHHAIDFTRGYFFLNLLGDFRGNRGVVE